MATVNVYNEDFIVRPEVAEFAIEMEKILNKHDNKKPAWPDMTREAFLAKLTEEFSELIITILDEDATFEDVSKEAIDLGNMAMMAWDRGRKEID